MSNPLKFYLGEESHHIVESYDEKDSSLFADQYNKALGIIEHYIYAQEGHNDDKQGNLRNNIVAFLGDRGTGKTSCMLSVLNMLDKHFEKKNFAKIDTIDPSFFDENTNILFLVIGKMFATFKKDMESKDSRMGRKNQEIHDLTKTFHDVQSCLSRMQKSPLDDNDNDMNQLSNLLVTVELKENLEKLVNNYLKFFGLDYLVVPIDDIDNNTQHAYTMSEQLRKYLVLPKVIILISFKLEQLTHVIDLHFTKMYEPLIRQKRFNTEDIVDMTQKYLLKLIPLNQRVTLPNMEVMMDRVLVVYENREKSEPILSRSSVKYTMTALIFRKTRYLFYHSTGETCPIVPKNLREYRTLLSMLCNMDDYNTEKDGYNKRLFLDYFYEDWTDKHLDEKGKKIAHMLIENKEPSSFNKLVLNNLSDLFSEIPEFQELLTDEERETLENRFSGRLQRSLYKQYPSEFQRIVDKNNSTYNISIGDVFAVLNEIKRQVVAEEDKMLLFFIESLYSIKLYHYYDEITEYDQEKTTSKNSIDETIKRLDLLEDTSNYEKLIGGNFFNPNMLQLLPNEKSWNNISRAYRVVNLAPLRDLFKDENLGGWNLQTIEFFALTLSRRLYSKTKNDIYPKYRQKQEVYYRSDLSNVKKAVFDLGSFFSNIIDIKHAYNRFDKDLYEKAEKYDNSLLNRIKQKTMEKYPNLKDKKECKSHFLSWCCIRNAVILQDFGYSFSYIKTRKTKSSNQLQLLHDFFKEVSEYKIKTYDKPINNDAYTISFDYAKVFVEYFSNMQESDEAKTLFYNVFGDINIEEKINLNIDEILNNCKNGMLKSTLKTRIIKNNPELKDNAEFWRNFDSMIVTTKISKEPARQVLEYLKKQFGY